MIEKEVAPPQTQTVPVEEGAEAFVELLNANEVKYIFLNPGSDTFPILEAISKFKTLGKPTPGLILCYHESLAMTAAHGYFMVTERPQVVLVHESVGTQQVGGALHNAQRGMAGIILCAGRPSWTFEGERRGGRDIPGLWCKEYLDQAGMVRGFVKWDYELRCNDNIQHVVQRAFQIASTEPHGPVYLILPRELLMEKMTAVHPLPRTRYGPALSPQADESALAETARLLISARNPLVITSFLGRHPQAVAPFVKLAETLALRVVSVGVRMNFPTSHPLWAGISPNPYLKDADVILIVDQPVPYVPVQAQPRADAKIIYLDIDPVKADYPMWNFPADIRMQADSSKAIPVLNQLVSQLATARDQARFRERFQRLQKEHEAQRAEWKRWATVKAGQRPMSAEWLAHCIGEEVDQDTIIIDETVTNWPTVARHVHRSQPGTIFRTAGSSLGWGLGCALGAKLGAPQKTVICLTGDGGFLFGHPTAALWAASNYRAPFLTIIWDNGGYYAVKQILTEGYGAESYTAKRGSWEAVDFTAPPDYVQIAQACGASGETIEEPGALRPAIRKALEKVRGGQPVVLRVILEKPA